MVEKSNIIFGGIATLLIVLSSGLTYYVQSTGEKTGCSLGWSEYNATHYACLTKTPRYETCYKVYDSSGTKNYWCEKGKIVLSESKPEPETEIEQEPKQVKKEYITCTPLGCV